MASECVIVPTYQRPEMLTLCIEAIQQADPYLEVLVFHDRGETELTSLSTSVTQLTTRTHSYHGNSYNVLNALSIAQSHSARYDRVFIVEDDAIVDPSFFDWCRQALSSHPDAFAACGWQYSPDAVVGDGPDMLLPWYLSVATCLPRSSVSSIVQHALPAYYTNMKAYLDRALPSNNRRGSMHYEQDGLALRVCESEGKRCVWPRRPRATHIGWRGYHQTGGKELPGTLEERVAALRLIVQRPDLLQKMMVTGQPPRLGTCDECKEAQLVDREGVRVVCSRCWHKHNPTLPLASTTVYYFPTVLQYPSVTLRETIYRV